MLSRRLLRRITRNTGRDDWKQRYLVGRGTYGVPNILEWPGGTTLRVGSFCSIAEDVTIVLGGNHRVDRITTFPFSELGAPAREIVGHPASRGDVVIGNDVWIGTKALILSGVRVGDGAVVGAGAVVSRDVSPYGIVVGNPARLVRTRFPPEEVAVLLALEWWNWDDAKLRAATPHLLNNSVGGLKEFSDRFDRAESIFPDRAGVSSSTVDYSVDAEATGPHT